MFITYCYFYPSKLVFVRNIYYLIVERDAFYSMSHVYPEINPTIAGIYMTNAFDISEEDIVIYDHDEDLGDGDGHGDDGNDSIQHHFNLKVVTTITSQMMTSTNDNHSHSDNHISGMFLAIGRLNHSCIPNAQQTFIPLQRNNKKYNNVKINTNTSHDNNNSYNNDNRRSSSSCIGYEVLYATRDIMIGEEINDCYIELRQSSKDRRKELMSLYRFKCLCKICSINDDDDDDDDDKDDGGGEDDDDDIISKEMNKQKLREGIQIDDDRRRQRAMQLDEAIYEFLSMGEYNMAQDISIELIKLLEHTKSIGWG